MSAPSPARRLAQGRLPVQGQLSRKTRPLGLPPLGPRRRSGGRSLPPRGARDQGAAAGLQERAAPGVHPAGRRPIGVHGAARLLRAPGGGLRVSAPRCCLQRLSHRAAGRLPSRGPVARPLPLRPAELRAALSGRRGRGQSVAGAGGFPAVPSAAASRAATRSSLSLSRGAGPLNPAPIAPAERL